MSEFESDRLPEPDAAAAGRRRLENAMPAAWHPSKTPRAANDNQVAWPLLPFPDGWRASC